MKSIILIVFFCILNFSFIAVSASNTNEVEAANALAVAGYIVDHSDDTAAYNLNQNVLRQEIAAVARGIAGLEKKSTCDNEFTDISATTPNTWACYSVEALLDANLIARNNKFNPENNITKAESIAMMVKAVFPEYSYDSSENSPWQEQVINFAVSKWAVNYFYDFDTSATRGFVFEVAYNLINWNIEKTHITWLVTMWKALDEYNNWNKLKELYIHPEVYDWVVINTFWEKLEPSKDKYDFSSIENTLNEIKKYNKKYPNHKILAKIRTFAWTFSPDYVKKLNNWPVTVYPNNRPSVKIPLYWTKEYWDRFAKLIKKLAEKYDNNPLIAEITVNTASCLTAEPFIAPLNKKSKEELHKFWFNDSLYKAALRRGLEDYKVWKNTWVDFDFNTFILSDWKFNKLDPDFTIQLMKDFKKQYWENWIISHHWLQDPLSKSAKYFYPTIKELWGSISFQTVWPKVDFDLAINLGLEYWMTQFEMWQTKEGWGYADIWIKKLKEWRDLLEVR